MQYVGHLAARYGHSQGRTHGFQFSACYRQNMHRPHKYSYTTRYAGIIVFPRPDRDLVMTVANNNDRAAIGPRNNWITVFLLYVIHARFFTFRTMDFFQFWITRVS